MTDLPAEEKPEDEPAICCTICGKAYFSPKAKYCTECKFFRNPLRQWLTSFNASGWTAFIAVAGLTATTFGGVYNLFVDNVDIYGGVCRPRQMIVTLVNGEARGVVIRNVHADIVYRENGIEKRKFFTSAKVLLKDKLPSADEEHLESDLASPLTRGYGSFLIEKGTKMPGLPEEFTECTVRYSATYAYSPFAEPKQRDVGGCSCASFKS